MNGNLIAQTAEEVTDVVGAGTESVFGTIKPPAGVEKYNAAGGIGILAFLSQVIQLVFVVAGLWVMYNVISAGFTYLTSQGDSKAHEKVKNQITYSLIGLIIIVSSFGFAALIGQIFFGNPSFILNPTLQGPAA